MRIDYNRGKLKCSAGLTSARSVHVHSREGQIKDAKFGRTHNSDKRENGVIQ